jgi:hypothetical protein
LALAARLGERELVARERRVERDERVDRPLERDPALFESELPDFLAELRDREPEFPCAIWFSFPKAQCARVLTPAYPAASRGIPFRVRG